MVAYSGTKVINGVASSRIDLSDACFRNVLLSFVQPYEALKIPKITNTTLKGQGGCDSQLVSVNQTSVEENCCYSLELY